jgi:hypothetical protein
MGTSGDEGEMEHDDGTTKNVSKDELLLRLNEQAKDVKWTATEGIRDRVPADRTRHRNPGQRHQTTEEKQLTHCESTNTSDEHGKPGTRRLAFEMAFEL